MKIVIDIPDGFIKDCDGNLDCVISMSGYEIDDVCSEEMGYTNFKYQEIPKGHGRLIDADAKNKELADEYHGMISDESIKIYKIIQMLDDAPTIIDADKESD